jgi:heat shock protein HtpX
MNHMRTAILLAALTAIFGTVGLLLGGGTGMVVALGFAVATNAFAYWSADSRALAAHGAQQVDEQTAPELVSMVNALADRAQMPRPRVFIVNSPQPNAFATGRNPQNGAVAITTGLLDMLTPDEVAGVMAHELAHIKSYDTLTMTIAATIAGAMSSLMNFGFIFASRRDRPNPIAVILMAIVAPLGAAVIQMAISRGREYEADRIGAEISGNPLHLASALDKIAGGVSRFPSEQAERNPAMAPMFIINPLAGWRMDGLFSTHPATENRIAALMQQADALGLLGAPDQSRSASRGPWG